MSWFAVGALAVSVVGTAVSSISQKKAADNAASVDTATAAYNNKYDISLAQQLDLDTIQNIDTERQNDTVYLSRQAASYASAGVLATSGSALRAQITTAGRFEQKIQQQWQDSQQQQQQYYSAGLAGIAYGQAQASADTAQGNIALINGGASIAGSVFKAYGGGAFAFGTAGAPAAQTDTTFYPSNSPAGPA